MNFSAYIPTTKLPERKFENTGASYLAFREPTVLTNRQMVLNLSPLAAHMGESLCSLRFATKVRIILILSQDFHGIYGTLYYRLTTRLWELPGARLGLRRDNPAEMSVPSASFPRFIILLRRERVLLLVFVYL